jgi:hypothetical protein
MATATFNTIQMAPPPGGFSTTGAGGPLQVFVLAKVAADLTKKTNKGMPVVGVNHIYTLSYQKTNYHVDVRCTAVNLHGPGGVPQYQLDLYDVS